MGTDLDAAAAKLRGQAELTEAERRLVAEILEGHASCSRHHAIVEHELVHLRRKIAHGCTDAYCSDCDGEEEA